MTVIKEFQDNLYCDMSANAKEAIAGKDLLLCVFDMTGENLLAISGQNELEINRERNSITINSKTIEGGWEDSIAGTKKWDISVDGVWNYNKKSHATLEDAYENDKDICIKIINKKSKEAVYGGLAMIESYPITAGSEDAANYTLKLKGKGKLVYLVEKQKEAPAMPGIKA